MSVFHAGASGIDMLNLTFTSGAVASQFASSTATGLNFTDGSKLIFHGSFTGVSGDKISGGTITGVEFDYAGGTPSFWIDGFSKDAITLINDFNARGGNILFENDLFDDGSTFIGSSGTDFLFSLAHNATYIGGSGTETFETASGNDTIIGGSGVDTVNLIGVRSEYSIVDNHDGSITLADSVATRDGTDHISNVGFLQFKDQLLILTDGNAANIARLYSAALGREPDPAGLVSWEHVYQNNIAESVKQQGVFVALSETSGNYNGSLSIAGGFTNSTEFQQRYGVLDDNGFVTALYRNVLGRDPDASGLNTWLDVMHNGDSHGTHFTREMVLVGIAESPENIAKAGAWLYVV